MLMPNFGSVRIKLIIAFLLLISVPSAVIATFFYNKSVDALQGNIALTIMNNLHQQAKAFDNVFENIYYQTISLSTDNELIKELSKVDESINKDLNRKVLLNISSLLSNRKVQDKYIDSIYIYLPKTNEVVTSYITRKVVEPNETKLIEDYWQPKSNGNNWFSVISRKDNLTSLGKSVFSISKEIKYMGKSEPLGKLWLNIDERVIYFNILDSIYTSEEDDVSILDSNGVVVSNKKVGKIGVDISKTNYSHKIMNKDDGYFLEEVDGRKALVVFVTTRLTKYKIAYMVPLKVITSEIDNVKGFVMGLSTVLIITCLILSFVFSINISKPIFKLKHAMLEVGKGNFDIYINEKRKDEFGTLNDGFNQMISEVKLLFNEVYKQKLLKKEAELNALQSQITPHFLYNTLNSIRYAAILQNATIVSDMLEALVELLQLSTGKYNESITIKDEIQQVKNYMKLQMFRYRDLFVVEYEIEEEILNYRVPKLVLQPLVENSILHGINLRRGDGRIIVRCKKQDTNIVLEVEDNGIGITEDKVHEILCKKRNDDDKFSGIGVNNVNERIKIHFGDSYGLTYTNAHNGGTIATILIPLIIENEGCQ
jgi:two-component system sensor histidine kinase YesM